MDCIGYILKSTASNITVVLPEKPFGKLKLNLPQKDKKVDAECYDKYELKGFQLDLDAEGNVLDWKFKNVMNLVDVHYFVALLTDKRIIAEDGKAYKIWDNKLLVDDYYVSQFDWMFSSGLFSSVNNIQLLIRNGIIYGAVDSKDYKFRNSWDIEDTLAKYLNGYDRYKVINNAEIANKQRGTAADYLAENIGASSPFSLDDMSDIAKQN